MLSWVTGEKGRVVQDKRIIAEVSLCKEDAQKEEAMPNINMFQNLPCGMEGKLSSSTISLGHIV